MAPDRGRRDPVAVPCKRIDRRRAAPRTSVDRHRGPVDARAAEPGERQRIRGQRGELRALEAAGVRDHGRRVPHEARAHVRGRVQGEARGPLHGCVRAGELSQLLGERRGVVAEDRQALAQRPPPNLQAETKVAQARRGPRALTLELPGERPRVAPQLRQATRGQQDQHRPARLVPRRVGRMLRRFDHQVRVGSPGAKRADPRAQRQRLTIAPARRPRLRLREQLEGRALELELGVGRLSARRGGQGAVPHLQQHARQRGDPGRSLEVTQVGLERAKGHARRGRLDALPRLVQPADLDWIAEGGAGPVGLDIRDAAGVELRVDDGCPNQAPLRVRVGDHERPGLAAMVEGRAADHRVHVIPVGERVGQRLEQHDARALAGDDAVRLGPKRIAAPRWRGQPHLLHVAKLRGVRRQADAAGQRPPTLARPDRLNREVDRAERRRTRAVDREARAVEIQAPRHAVGDRVVERWDRVATQRILMGHHARVDADRRRAPKLLAQRLRRVASVFDGLPRDLEEQPLLRIHARGLVR
ncbi:hypothetical protein DB30_03441 [Enhygromyxa salina]|uniref:Uncharacterized protein n=1 Tax=Enhygromyxa salina TaxID=215803 RepID=A0A0C2A1K8_9BACT|nr:hypothetical protein DB30_03441 [Enhygromyxa salina]